MTVEYRPTEGWAAPINLNKTTSVPHEPRTRGWNFAIRQGGHETRTHLYSRHTTTTVHEARGDSNQRAASQIVATRAPLVRPKAHARCAHMQLDRPEHQGAARGTFSGIPSGTALHETYARSNIYLTTVAKTINKASLQPCSQALAAVTSPRCTT